MSKRFYILLALAIVLATAVSACQPSAKAPTQPSSGGNPTQEPAGEQPTQAPSSEALKPYLDAKIDWKQFAGQQIVVGVIGFGDTDVLKGQVAEFEELTGIKVDYQIYSEAEWNEKSVVDLSSTAGAFDVVLTDFAYLPQFSKAGFIERVDQYLSDPQLTDAAWYDQQDLFPALQKAAQVNGENWGVPLTTETTLLYYRKDLLEAAGLEPPKTVDELLAAAKALNKPGEVAGIALRGLRGQGLNMYIFTGFLRAFGGNFFRDFPNDMTPVLNSPEAIRAAQYYGDILKECGPAGAANWDWAEVLAGMQQGKVAMAIDASDFGFQIDDSVKSQTAGKWGYAMVPEGPAGRFPSAFSFLLTINADSKAKGAAWLFCEWATSKPCVRERALQTGTATRKSVWQDPQLAENLKYVGNGTWMDVFAKSLEIADADYRPRFPHWREVGDRLGMSVQSVISGEKVADVAMNEAQRDIETVMKENGYIQ